MLRRESLLLLAGSLVPIRALRAQYAPAVAKWNRAINPVRIIGDLYYVGASDVSAFLFTSSDGHILLDTGFQETVPLLEANLRKLGFRLADVRIIVASHAHYDHAGGIAEVKRRTGARFLVNPIEAPAFHRGGKGDFAFGDKYPFPPAQPDGKLEDGKPVSIGTISLTPRFTPGHTKGNTSWTYKVKEGGRTYNVVIGASMSAPGYRLIANAEYPEIARDFETSFAKLRAMPCDIFLSFHSWDFDLHNKLKRLKQAPKQNPFIDRNACAAFVEKTQAAYRESLNKQRAAACVSIPSLTETRP